MAQGLRIQPIPFVHGPPSPTSSSDVATAAAATGGPASPRAAALAHRYARTSLEAPEPLPAPARPLAAWTSPGHRGTSNALASLPNLDAFRKGRIDGPGVTSTGADQRQTKWRGSGTGQGSDREGSGLSSRKLLRHHPAGDTHVQRKGLCAACFNGHRRVCRIPLGQWMVSLRMRGSSPKPKWTTGSLDDKYPVAGINCRI